MEGAPTPPKMFDEPQIHPVEGLSEQELQIDIFGLLLRPLYQRIMSTKVLPVPGYGATVVTRIDNTEL